MEYHVDEMGISCFKLVKIMLDVLYDQIPFPSEQAKDAAIKRGFEHLRGTYKDLTTFRADYSKAATRFAYIYRYAPSHADIAYQLIRNTPELCQAFKANRMKNITCLGAGPGSELVGMLKFLKRTGTPATLQCSVCDQKEMWEAYWKTWGTFLVRWRDEIRYIEGPIRNATSHISQSFCPFNVTDTRIDNHLLNADLFTMSFFLSEIYFMKKRAGPFIEYLFKNAKPGSLLLFIDSCAERFDGWQWFDALAQRHGLEIIGRHNKYDFHMEYSEQMRHLQRFYTKFGESASEYPKLGDPIAYRICRKL